jgi:exonuclease SbcC
LRAVLPAVSVVLSMKADAKQSQERTARFERQKAETQENKRQTDASLAHAKKSQAEAARQLAADETDLAQLNARLRELAGGLERVRQLEAQQAELDRHEAELKRQPPDPESALVTAQSEADRLTELSRVHPILDRLHKERRELTEALEAAAAGSAVLKSLEVEGKELNKAAANLTAELAAARAARTAAEQRAGVAAALADRAKAAAAEFESLTGAKDCPACGQELTAKHLDAERKRRRDEAASSERERVAADAVLKHATAVEVDAARRESESRETLTGLREKFAKLKAEGKARGEAAERVVQSLALRYADLPAPLQAKVAPVLPHGEAEWAATTYPDRADLTAMYQDVKTLPAAIARLARAREALTHFGKLRVRAEAARDALDKLRQGLQGTDPVKLRAEHQTLSGREKSLVNAIKGGKQAVADCGREADTLTGESHRCVQTLTDLAGKLANEINVRKNAADNADRAKRELPPEWQKRVDEAGLGADSGWKAEAERLEADGVAAKFAGLASARAGLDTLRDALRAQEAEAAGFPPESRRDPDEVRVTLNEAKGKLAAAEQAHVAALQQRGKLDDYRAQREALGTETRQLDAKFTRYKTLADLLGRDRLQRYLVRRAERQIVDYANGVLDRLSGGQLFLKLASGEETGADKALELEAYNRVTGGAPIPVAFLSGSQKFRVAVCLALGIGQYASRQHRPIESVIIDEGFGCLDRQGRQVMIQELQNLRGHLHCILLVSHQEEFADAFPDGYRFELQDGATKVSRFQR